MDTGTITLVAGIVSCVIGVSTFITGRMAKAEQNGAMETKITQALDGITAINKKLEAFSNSQQDIQLLTRSNEERIKNLYSITDGLKEQIENVSKTNDILSDLLAIIKDK